MCPHYITDEDQFGVGIGEWCSLIDELLQTLCPRDERQDDSQDWDSSEDIPY